MAATVLVTGYGGFLGRAICHDLLHRGYRVRGLARNIYPDMATKGVVCLRGSATDYPICKSSSQGVDAIIHTAALAGVWGPRKLYETNNVTATQNLLRASEANKVRAFVYTSSPSVTFDGKPQRSVDESVGYPDRWLCDYPRTKAIAEKLVLDANQSGSFSTCSLRPHLIWGVGDPHLIPRVIERCRTKRLRRVGDGRNLIDTVHVDAAAMAHRLALDRLLDHDGSANGRSYFITDGAPVACWDWITTILKSANLVPPQKSITTAAAYRIGYAMEIVYRMLRISNEPPMTRFVALQLGVDHYFDIRAAKERLGYVPLSDREERIAELSNSYKH